ncbi:MAG: peroxiredoxin [Ahrensia sp.]|nr:peroxiredoxin [Ahrensia sp.]
MAIQIGDRLPDATFMIMSDDGPAKMTTAELFTDKKTVVLFAVPGAFTPTCHANHLPGFLEHIEEIKEKGVDAVAVTAVNDVFVFDAWSTASKGKGKIHFLADPGADFAKAVGMDIDLTAAGLGVRSKRYSMLVKDGKVVQLNVEDNPGQAEKSSAAVILGQL